MYGEAGLTGEAVAVWLYEAELLVVYEDEFLAQYTVQYQADHHHLKTVTEPRLYPTQHQSPQLSLWDLGDDTWRKAVPVRPYVVRREPQELPEVVQTMLPLDDVG